METTTDLETIKWLLVAILSALVVIAIAAIFVAAVFWYAMKSINEQNSGKVFKHLAEDYLTKNELEDLSGYVNERLETHPQDVWAYWYKGQGEYHAGDYNEAKRSFEKVTQLEPGWEGSASPWIARINEELDKGPQLVE